MRGCLQFFLGGGRRARAAVASLVFLCGPVACHDPTSPTALRAARDIQAATQTPDYYVYGGQRVNLVEDPTSLIVETTTDTATIRTQVAQQLELAIDSVITLPSMRTHKRVFLSSPIAGRVANRVKALRSQLPTYRYISPVYRTEDGHLYVPLDRIVVRFRSTVDPAAVAALADTLGLQIERPLQPDSAHDAYWLTSAPGSLANIVATAASLASDKRVVWAEPDRISDEHVDFVPNDTYLGSQFFLNNSYVDPSTGVAVDIDAEPAWDLTTGSSSITVAVIDEGIQAAHPDLAGRVTAGHDEFPGFTGEDALHPCGVICTHDSLHGDAHGTAVAGIIAADQNNSLGVSGIAPGVNLVSVRALRNNAGGTSAQLADAITWAYSTAHADVINNSWGGGAPSSAVNSAISNAVTSGRGGKGAIVVFSTGNDGMSSLAWPASEANSLVMLAVGAITNTGALAYYSNYGTGLTVVAPSSGGAQGVTTTDLVGTGLGYDGGPGGDDDYTTTFGGTSAAAPEVSAVAALLLSREPTLLKGDVLTRIIRGADPWGSSTYFGWGKVNAYRTLVMPEVGINGLRTPRTAGSYTYSALVNGGVGPFTYDWERDDGGGSYYVSSASSYTTNIASGDPSFHLVLNVTGSGGVVSTSGIVQITNMIP